MTKDPAVLFYTSDFITGTALMNFEEKGQYIYLLCLQHQQGSLEKEDLLSITSSKKVLNKFVLNEDGKYHNVRMTEEKLRRNKFSESRRANAKHMHSTSKALAKHMETENINTTSSIVCNTTPTPESSNQEQVKYNTDINMCLVDEVIDDLNAVLGVNYKKSGRKTRELIGARIKDGFGLEDFKKVHRVMFQEWGKDDKMRKYLRPVTLYCASKFESYLNRPLDKYSGLSDVEKSIIKTAEEYNNRNPDGEKICLLKNV